MSVPSLDKVIVITGAGSGFGRETARAAARDGARVVVADISESGKAVAEEIVQAGGKAIFVKADVTSRVEWEALLKATIDAFGEVNALVNNAGWSYRNKKTLEVSEDEFDRVFNINVKSIYHSVNVIIPQMIKQGKGGAVINISSISALRPRPGLTWYAATKGAVTTATKALATDYAPHNIRFNCVSPVLSTTGLLSTFTGMEDTPENNAKFLANIPLGRLGSPTDIAEMVVFLANEKAQFVTGVDVAVDGGRGI